MTTKLTVGVIFGSRSVEHDVSIVTAQQVMRALDPDRYSVVPVYITREGGWLVGDPLRDISSFEGDRVAEMLGIKEAVLSCSTDFKGLIIPPISGLVGRNTLRKLDVLFPVVHGSHGEDGTLQGLIELVDLPYVGCGVLASAIAIDKAMTKTVLSAHGIAVLPWEVVRRSEWVRAREAVLDRLEGRFAYPVFVKPATLGSSIGIARVTDREALGNYIDVAANFDQRILIEPALEGAMEVNCAVLGNDDEVRPSVCEQPITWEEFLTYEEKYMREGGGMKGAERRIPAPISEELTRHIQQTAVAAFKAISGRGTARVDFLVREKDGQVVVNEINTMPGSLAFYLWEAEGLSPRNLVDELIRLAFEAHAQKRQTRYNYKTGLVAHAAARGLKGVKGIKS
ncbi:MAG: D-alanine--D-alanine ligase [Anaerolineae bacterium]|nr:D-alanine--D-alanine ligase [Anaerolineae bacterium]